MIDGPAYLYEVSVRYESPGQIFGGDDDGYRRPTRIQAASPDRAAAAWGAKSEHSCSGMTLKVTQIDEAGAGAWFFAYASVVDGPFDFEATTRFRGRYRVLETAGA